MKKIIIAILALVALSSAEVIIGTEVFYGKVNSDITASYQGATASESTDTKTLGLTLKAGYEWDNIRLLGTVTSEKYKDDVMAYEEGNLLSYGAELGYLMALEDSNNLYIGGIVATGEKDFNIVDIDFKDYGVRVSIISQVNDSLQLEVGAKYINRQYDSYLYQGISLDLDENIISVYLGVNFSL